MRKQCLLPMVGLLILGSSLALGAEKTVPERSPELTLEGAKKIADKASKFAVGRNLKVSIAIVNGEGTLVYFERANGSFSGSVEAAIRRARSASAWQRPTSVFAEAVNKGGRVGLLSGNDVVAIEGGLPITVQGHHLGAIGVSGGKATEDEEVAKAGLE